MYDWTPAVQVCVGMQISICYTLFWSLNAHLHLKWYTPKQLFLDILQIWHFPDVIINYLLIFFSWNFTGILGTSKTNITSCKKGHNRFPSQLVFDDHGTLKLNAGRCFSCRYTGSFRRGCLPWLKWFYQVSRAFCKRCHLSVSLCACSGSLIEAVGLALFYYVFYYVFFYGW